MPKKGVFGMKSMPLDMPTTAPKQPAPPREVRIRAAKSGGFIVSTSPLKSDSYRDEEHAAATIEDVITIMEKHLSGDKMDSEKE